MLNEPTNLDYLIENLRLWLGDTTPSMYRYSDAWLRTALVGAVKALRGWWHDKYLVNDDSYLITRNDDRQYMFEYAEPPIIDHRDEMPIILMASIIVKSGSLQNAAWDLASWRDFEISYSPQAKGRELNDSLKRDWDSLKDYLKPPQKRLATPSKRSLIGYKNNQYERNTKDLG
jgi:hypothetical protein